MKKILVIDDDIDWLNVFSVRLQYVGYQIFTMFDTLQAKRKVAEIKPDAILLDIMMPAGGGLSILEYIRKNTDTFSTPVIVITGKTDESVKKEAERLGISGYYIKPINSEQILKKLEAVLGE